MRYAASRKACRLALLKTSSVVSADHGTVFMHLLDVSFWSGFGRSIVMWYDVLDDTTSLGDSEVEHILDKRSYLLLHLQVVADLVN